VVRPKATRRSLLNGTVVIRTSDMDPVDKKKVQEQVAELRALLCDRDPSGVMDGSRMAA